MRKYYELPPLPFGKDALEPYISEEQLAIHHDKHHQGYVDGANSILKKLEKARTDNEEVDMKSVLKAMSFNIGGHKLHSLFWKNLAPSKHAQAGPTGKLKDAIDAEFGSLLQFKKEFSQAAASVEGSGWSALAYDRESDRLLIMNIEKHNVNVHPTLEIIMLLDVWEHAYYLDYKNQRAKFIDAFWNIVDWEEAGRRFESAAK